MTLKGAGLGEPEPVTDQDGQLFYLYKLENISVGKTLDLTFEGKPVIPQSQNTLASTEASSSNAPNQLSLFAGLGILGVVLIGGGAYWWVRSSRAVESSNEEDQDGADGEVFAVADQEFEQLLTEIAELDQRFEQGEVNEAIYHEQRALLMAQAKAAQSEAELSPVTEVPDNL